MEDVSETIPSLAKTHTKVQPCTLPSCETYFQRALLSCSRVPFVPRPSSLAITKNASPSHNYYSVNTMSTSKSIWYKLEPYADIGFGKGRHSIDSPHHCIIDYQEENKSDISIDKIILYGNATVSFGTCSADSNPDRDGSGGSNHIDWKIVKNVDVEDRRSTRRLEFLPTTIDASCPESYKYISKQEEARSVRQSDTVGIPTEAVGSTERDLSG